MPAPLRRDDIDGIHEYFIIVESGTKFKLALTLNDAEANIPIDITTTGIGNTYVGQLANTFGTSNTHDKWKHYVVDDTNLVTVKPPFIVKGIQSLINIIDGHAAFLEDQGWVVNEDKSLRDPVDTSRFLNYHTELERFIDFEFNLQIQNRQVTDIYPVTVNVDNNEFTFVENGSTVKFATGDPVSVYVKDNIFPDPLYNGGRYYIIRDTSDTFRLASTKNEALKNNEINPYFQLKLDLKTQQYVGAEALARWHHGDKGLISPASFIPVAEETGTL